MGGPRRGLIEWPGTDSATMGKVTEAQASGVPISRCGAGRLSMKMQPPSVTQLDFMVLLLQGMSSMPPPMGLAAMVMPPIASPGAALTAGAIATIVALT